MNQDVDVAASGPASYAPLAHKEDVEAFRVEIRRWLEAVVPQNWQETVATEDPKVFKSFQRWWFEELRKVGLTNAHWPKEWGGEGLSLRHRAVVFEEMARAGAPSAAIYVISLYHLPATLFAHGTPAQNERFLRGVTERGEIWAQGFSEPGAGSDLASLRTRAEKSVVDGREVYIVNGQKIWSSYGTFADWYLLLARTNPDAPKKQGGISYMIMDMKSPGVTVRPIEQINGDADFAEVFLDNVEIPLENLIGAENEGWMIAQSTLAAERGLILFEAGERLAFSFEQELRDGLGGWAEDVELRRQFASLYARMRAARLLAVRMLREIEDDPEHGGFETATYIKLHFAVLLQDYSQFLVRVSGLDGQIARPAVQGEYHFSRRRMNDFLGSFTWTISGGSNEIMRNVIAERIIGLPRG